MANDLFRQPRATRTTRETKAIPVSSRIVKHKTPRPHRPHRTSGVAVAARAPTFRELSHTDQAPREKVSYPFVGTEYDRRARDYDAQSRAWMARALLEPGIVTKINHNTGTAPELVVLGRYLSLGYILGKNLIFQDEKIRSANAGFRRLRKRFVADVAIISPGGVLVLFPIDGVAWHERLQVQIAADQARNRALTKPGTEVVPISEKKCFHAADLNDYLRSKGLP